MEEQKETRPSETPESRVFQRIPPHSLEAEEAVLGAMFLDEDAVYAAMELLKPEDFYRADHRILFETIVELQMTGQPADIILVKEKLEEKKLFEQVGGARGLAEVAASVGNSSNVRNYAKIVAEKSLLRKLIKAADKIQEMGYGGDVSAQRALEQAGKLVFDVAEDRGGGEFAHVRDVAVQAFERIEQVYQNKGRVTGVATGFVDFDQKTAGLQPSDLILVAARPSMGKTAFVLNIAQNAAIRGGVPTAIFSLEMSREQLVNRMLCAEAGIDAQKMRTGDLGENDWPELIRAMGPLAEAPIYIDDTPAVSPMEIQSKCRRLKMEKGLGLVIIDYMQLMSADGKNPSRQQEISEISRSLKALAREIDAPVIALSQLSRACEQRSDHRPMLSDLRESGAIEQDADVVAFLYRDEYYFPDSEHKNEAELIIAKQRNGPTGTVHLAWLGQYTRFGNLLKEDYSA